MTGAPCRTGTTRLTVGRKAGSRLFARRKGAWWRCNAAFSPDAAEIAWARRILAAFEEPVNVSKGAIRVDGKMVERLHLHRARSALAAAG